MPVLTRGLACNLQIPHCWHCNCTDSAIPEAAEHDAAVRCQGFESKLQTGMLCTDFRSTFRQFHWADPLQDG